MVKLSIFLLVTRNLSAESIPIVIYGIMKAAGFKNLQVPQYGYFTKIRSLLRPLNHSNAQRFCNEAKSLSLSFDETSFQTKEGSIFGVTMVNEKAETHLITMVEHNQKSATEQKYEIDVRLINFLI